MAWYPRKANKSLLWGIVLMGGLLVWGLVQWRSRALRPPTHLLALILPPEIEASDEPWLTRALWDGAEQVLMGERGLHLVHTPQVESYLEGLGGRQPQPEAAATRFGVQRVISMRGLLKGNALQVTVSVWEKGHGLLPLTGTIEGSLLAPEALFRALHGKLREALDLPPGPAPSPTRFPHHPEAWKAYGRSLAGLDSADLGLLEKSIVDLRACLALDPKFAPAQVKLAMGLGEQFIQTGWFHPGESRRNEFTAFQEAIFQAQSLDPTHIQVRMLAARLNLLDQNFQIAINQSEAVLKDDPFQVDAEVTIADCYLALPNPGAQELGKQRLERILALGDNRFYPHFRLAAVNLQKGHLDRALELGDQLILGWPDRMMAYVMSSNALLWLNRSKDARQRIEVGLLRFPEAKLLHRNLAYAAFEAKDEKTLEQELAFASQAWSPDQSTAIMLQGLRPAVKGDLAATRGIYEGFLRRLETGQIGQKVEPLAASVDLYFMARTLATLGDPEKGKPYLNAAERMFPNWSQPTRMDPAFR